MADPNKDLNDPNAAQLKRYARDLSEIYRSEKQKRQALEQANAQLEKYAHDLGQILGDLKNAHQALGQAYLDTINRLVMAAEYKDEDTGDHIVRIGEYSEVLGMACGLDARQVELIRYASPMHDIGKIGIPDQILLKPGKLTAEEWEIMKTHTTIGAKILSGSKAEVLEMGCLIAAAHHEKWDGTGYPRGLSRHDIPIAGQIVGMADVFDALTSKRPYKPAYPLEKTLEIITGGRGSHFDPDLVDVFMAHLDQILEIRKASGQGSLADKTAGGLSQRDGGSG